jgi:hypothetical protein
VSGPKPPSTTLPSHPSFAAQPFLAPPNAQPPTAVPVASTAASKGQAASSATEREVVITRKPAGFDFALKGEPRVTRVLVRPNTHYQYRNAIMRIIRSYVDYSYRSLFRLQYPYPVHRYPYSYYLTTCVSFSCFGLEAPHACVCTGQIGGTPPRHGSGRQDRCGQSATLPRQSTQVVPTYPWVAGLPFASQHAPMGHGQQLRERCGAKGMLPD